jgi:hypothetical protein
VLATAVLPAKVVEDALAFTVDSAHNARDFAHHTFLAFKEPHAGDKLLESLKAVESVAEYAIRVEPGATVSVQTSRLAVKEGLSLTQQLARSFREAKAALNFQPLGESGHVLLPSFRGPKSAISTAELSVGKSILTDYRATFFSAHPELKGKVFVHHAVEQQALKRYPGAITEAELHSLENLRGIPKELNGQVHLSQIRREWDNFYRTHANATKQDLLNMAAEIDRKFGNLFTPRR